MTPAPESESILRFVEKRDDGDKVRVLRGVIDMDSDPQFAIVKRRDGVWKISKATVLAVMPAPRRDRREFDY